MGGVGFNRQIQIQKAFCDAAIAQVPGRTVHVPRRVCGIRHNVVAPVLGTVQGRKDRAVRSSRVLGSILAAYKCQSEEAKGHPAL